MKRGVWLPLSGLLAGTVFGSGLVISGMTNPRKVMAFLDLFGQWDPSLLVTMGAAVLVTFAGYRWVLQRGPLLEEKLHLPTKTLVDRRLLFGAAIFGTGWGLAGFCPGPALTGLGSGVMEPVIFIVAMICGSQVERLWLERGASVAAGH